MTIAPDGSWMACRRLFDDGIPFDWHRHAEFELTLTTNSRGLRCVGDSIEPYADGDLVLLGGNVPHAWVSLDKTAAADPHASHVFWLRPDLTQRLVDTTARLRPLKRMLLAAGRGVVYSADTSRAVRARVDALHAAQTAPERLERLIGILALLAQDRSCRLLCPPALPEQEAVQPSEDVRVERTLAYIHRHYDAYISIPELASLAALSVPALHRLFRRHTRLTVSDYIARLRIGKACSLLVSTSKPLSVIAAKVGYTNTGDFTRQFLALRKRTPCEFRSLPVPHP